MTEPGGVPAVGLLLSEGWTAYREGRFQLMLTLAGRAVQLANELDEPGLLAQSLEMEANALQILGDRAAALVRYTRIIGLSQDPATIGRLNDLDAAGTVAAAYWHFVASARYLTSIPVPELFKVLDAGEQWLTATGHQDWRAAILLQRGLLYGMLGQYDSAIAILQEALWFESRHPRPLGYTLSTYRSKLGEILLDAGRVAEAKSHYQAIFADPGTASPDKCPAHAGLAWCALAAGDFAGALREARAAVAMAESLGNTALCVSLSALAAALRAGGALDEASQTATRLLEAAALVGNHYMQWKAVSIATDIALDCGDTTRAARLVDDMAIHATAIDSTAGNILLSEQVARRRQQLARVVSANLESDEPDRIP